MTLQRRWRAWLNDHVVDHWLANGRYYQLNLIGGDHEYPEYRVAQDLRVATDAPVDFAVGLVSAALSAVTFIVVLWTVGGSLSFTAFGTAVVIPGFLVIAALVYAVAANGSMLLIGRRFVTVSEDVNQAEADYRYVLTRVRENGESIALLGGEAEERAGLKRSLADVLRRWRELCGQHMRTTVVSQGSSLMAPVIPIVLAAPKFLTGTMTLGEIMQAASAFTIVLGAWRGGPGSASRQVRGRSRKPRRSAYSEALYPSGTVVRSERRRRPLRATANAGRARSESGCRPRIRAAFDAHQSRRETRHGPRTQSNSSKKR